MAVTKSDLLPKKTRRDPNKPQPLLSIWFGDSLLKRFTETIEHARSQKNSITTGEVVRQQVTQWLDDYDRLMK